MDLWKEIKCSSKFGKCWIKDSEIGLSTAISDFLILYYKFQREVMSQVYMSKEQALAFFLSSILKDMLGEQWPK